MLNDTICAICTSMIDSAINIIRISGNEAINIVQSITKGVDLTEKNGGTISYGKIVDDNKIIDEVLISLFRAPKSYTKEDVIEINTHGGALVTTQVLELLLNKGCVLAEPGEFTKRAYLNGRIDLTQAEAVMDIINSETKESLELSQKALNGEVKTLVQNLRKDIEDILMHIEVNIDYPEYTDELQITNDICLEKTTTLINTIKDIIEEADKLRVYKEGLKTVILGKPNVGKSSLLNKLLKEERAIVTSYSGTTRDTIEGNINIGGIILHLIDTAGVRDATDPVEKIGIERTIKALEDAELVLLVLDESIELEDEDYKLLELSKNKKRIVIGNKSDIGKRNEFVELELSALTGDGIINLENTIKNLYSLDSIKNKTNHHVIASTRHINLLKRALEALTNAKEGSLSGLFVDQIDVDLRIAYDALGEIIGQSNPLELIDQIFKNFCLGK